MSTSASRSRHQLRRQPRLQLQHRRGQRARMDVDLGPVVTSLLLLLLLVFVGGRQVRAILTSVFGRVARLKLNCLQSAFSVGYLFSSTQVFFHWIFYFCNVFHFKAIIFSTNAYFIDSLLMESIYWFQESYRFWVCLLRSRSLIDSKQFIKRILIDSRFNYRFKGRAGNFVALCLLKFTYPKIFQAEFYFHLFIKNHNLRELNFPPQEKPIIFSYIRITFITPE